MSVASGSNPPRRNDGHDGGCAEWSGALNLEQALSSGVAAVPLLHKLNSYSPESYTLESNETFQFGDYCRCCRHW